MDIKRSESKKGNSIEDDLREVSLAAWLKTIKRHTGKETQVVCKK